MEHGWSRIDDAGVFFLMQRPTQPADRYIQITPEGRILTHHRGDDGQPRPYDTAEVLSHTTLGDTLGELAPDDVANRMRQAATLVVIEQIEPQKPLYEVLAEMQPDDVDGHSTTGENIDGDGTTPPTPGGPADTPNNTTTGQETTG